jgi:hypothetical protein
MLAKAGIAKESVCPLANMLAITKVSGLIMPNDWLGITK